MTISAMQASPVVTPTYSYKASAPAPQRDVVNGNADDPVKQEERHKSTRTEYNQKSTQSDGWPVRWNVGIKHRAEGIGLDMATLKAKFSEISERAKNEGGLDNPKVFLKNLSAEDRQIVQAIHGMADGISDHYVDKTTEEGAKNLLLVADEQRDWDGDGFYNVGTAKGFRFPTDGTPDHVKKAWNQATEGMDVKSLLLAEGKMQAAMHGWGPTPEVMPAVDPFKTMDFTGVVDKALSQYEAQKSYMSAGEFEDSTGVWNKFSALLEMFQRSGEAVYQPVDQKV